MQAMRGAISTGKVLLVASAVALVGVCLNASPALAAGVLARPVASSAGTYGGIKYMQYDGTFSGRTSTGDYRVPYRITAPADPFQGNRTVLVEPPHAGFGLGALEHYLGRDFPSRADSCTPVSDGAQRLRRVLTFASSTLRCPAYSSRAGSTKRTVGPT